MTVIEFNFNDDWMGEIGRRLGDLNDKTPDVISQATNSTARKARKLIVQSLREHYAEDAKTKEYNAAMKIARASRKKYDATIYIRGKVQNLRRFNVSPKDPPASGSSRPPTTRAQVLLQGGLKELNKGGIKAFITTFKNGDVVVAQRDGSFYTYHRPTGGIDRHHEAIDKLWSISIPKMAESQLDPKTVRGNMRDTIQAILVEEIEKQIARQLAKHGGNAG